MNLEVKIPTLLGLSILITGIIAGIFLVSQNQIFKSRASANYSPKDIKIVNITPSSITIYWTTEEKSLGFIKAGVTPNLNLTFADDRDLQSPQKHFLHFITLTKLISNTTYFYQIISGNENYPKSGNSSFKTVAEGNILGQAPIVGSVLGPDSKPIDEAIISLNLPGAQELAAITKTGGNFVLPLSNLKTADLTADLDLSSKPGQGKLRIFDHTTSSEVLFSYPQTTLSFPNLTLGKNIDLSKPTQASASAVSSTPIQSGSRPNPKQIFDLNNDGVVNSLDVGLLYTNLGKDPKKFPGDFNNDGKIDQADVGLINNFLKTR